MFETIEKTSLALLALLANLGHAVWPHRAYLLTQVFIFVSSKGVRRGQGRPTVHVQKLFKTHEQTYSPKKIRLPTVCGRRNWQTYSLFIYFDTKYRWKLHI